MGITMELIYSNKTKMDISLDILQYILSYLKVGQISQLCHISHAFNLVCTRESLWKDKAWSDYGDRTMYCETWRETAIICFVIVEEFWKDLDEEISYYMTGGPFCRGTSKIENEYGFQIAAKMTYRFERQLENHALNEREEFYVTELIFKSFFNTDLCMYYTLDRNEYYIYFINLFSRITEGSASLISSRGKLSPLVHLCTGGKLSLRWILSLNHIEEVKFTDYLDISEEEYMRGWVKLNRHMYYRMLPLASLYKNYRYLFVDDTTDDQKDIVLMLNNWNTYLH
uniref:F-box-like family protein n=1 Tax=Pithovirus LCPAC401 TaxID=2506595 RepID=A0A481Z9G2_9VIRU|nr:MAG: F-box-like family protein [Pithovirus LCPAC401]